VLQYGTATTLPAAGVAFEGVFPGASVPGAVVYLGFPFETITTKSSRDTLMRRVFQFFDLLTGTGPMRDDGAYPDGFWLEQNYPNPFNPTTVIRFEIPGTRGQELGASDVRLVVYDLLGREVATLVNEALPAGKYHVDVDGSRFAGSSGVYFYRLEAGPYVQQRKMIFLK
jgi:hypothetical protein